MTEQSQKITVTLTIEVEVEREYLIDTAMHYSLGGWPWNLPSHEELVELFWEQLQLQQPAFMVEYEARHAEKR